MSNVKKLVVLAVVALLVLPMNALGTSDGSHARALGSRAGDWVIVSGSIRDGANQPPPKSFVLAANGTDWSYVNASITYDGDYSFGVPSNTTYIMLMVAFSGQTLDGYELHGYFPQGSHVTVNTTDIDLDFTIEPAYELVLNGTNKAHVTVDAGNFTNTRWSTEMDEAVAFAIWTDVDDGTGFKLPSVLIPPNEARDIWFQWEVPGFGRTVLNVDNKGTGFSGPALGGELVDVNYHLASTQLARMQALFSERFMDGYEFSDRTRGHMSNATSKCEVAEGSTGVNRLDLLDSCAAQALYAIESIELDRAEQDIEMNRKGDVEVTVVDSNGLPVEGAMVEFEQTDHDFLFGVFDNLQEAGIEGFQQVKEIGVNYATSGFYWGTSEPTEGAIAWDVMNMSWGFQELTDMGFKLKAHALIYMMDIVVPDYMKQKGFAEYKAKVYEHVHALVNGYKDYIDIWNVVNEAHGIGASGGFTRAQVTEIVKEGVRAIRDADPDGEIIINNAFDWFGQSRSAGYMVEGLDDFSLPIVQYMDLMVTEGVDFDIVGQQMYNGGYTGFFEKHGLGQDMPGSTFDLGFISHVFDELERYDRPIHMTELSVSGSWNDSWKDAGYWHAKWNQSVQAEFLRQFYTIGFSKKGVEALTWWDLDDNTTFLVDGGLFDDKMRPKEAFHALADLIARWTTVGNSTTSEDGVTSFRGFGGRYNMTVTWKGMSKEMAFHLSEEEDKQLLVTFENGTLVPDLELNHWEIKASLDGFKASGEVGISGAVNNVGEREAANITVRGLHGGPGTWEPIGDDVVIPSLQKGGSEVFEMTWNATDLFGNHSLRFMVDPDDDITELNESNNNASINVILPLPDWGWLSGRVVDNGTDAAIANASVDILLKNGTRLLQLISDDGGNFSYDKIPIGCYWVVARRTGYVASNVSACVDKAELEDVEVRLDLITWGNLIGTVFDGSTGKGIEGATISIPEEGLTTGTNLGGGYAFFDLPQGDYMVEVSANRYISTNGTATVRPNMTSMLDFHLTISTGDLEGQVTGNGTGAPISNATVLIPGIMGQITDANGLFIMLSIPVGTHVLEVGAADFVSKKVTVEITSGNTTSVDIVLEPVVVPPDPNGTISGHVYDKATGKPILRAVVTIKELDRALVTDGLGAFTLIRVAPGAYTVEVTAKGYRPSSRVITLEPQEDEVLDIELKRQKDGKDMDDFLGASIAMVVFLLVLVVFIVLLYMRVKRGLAKAAKKEEEEGLPEDEEGSGPSAEEE